MDKAILAGGICS